MRSEKWRKIAKKNNKTSEIEENNDNYLTVAEPSKHKHLIMTKMRRFKEQKQQQPEKTTWLINHRRNFYCARSRRDSSNVLNFLSFFFFSWNDFSFCIILNDKFIARNVFHLVEAPFLLLNLLKDFFLIFMFCLEFRCGYKKIHAQCLYFAVVVLLYILIIFFIRRTRFGFTHIWKSFGYIW